jgi:D-arabinose 1-dehydrogenase-like Zn-dependent alcohol dehydrogenase
MIIDYVAIGISTSSDKKAEVLGFGAQGFLNMNDAKEVAAAAGTFNFLLSTISADGINWDKYLDLLATGMISYHNEHMTHTVT